jgi:hypothetical protein
MLGFGQAKTMTYIGHKNKNEQKQTLFGYQVGDLESEQRTQRFDTIDLWTNC